jgi:hypothetical protein
MIKKLLLPLIALLLVAAGALFFLHASKDPTFEDEEEPATWHYGLPVIVVVPGDMVRYEECARDAAQKFWSPQLIEVRLASELQPLDLISRSLIVLAPADEAEDSGLLNHGSYSRKNNRTRFGTLFLDENLAPCECAIVVAHEVGHGFDLAHDSSAMSLMHPSWACRAVELSRADKAAVSKLYNVPLW